ncbi:hypothetical protein MMUR_28440 [Mycolicibacterium murale]|uniref:Metallo-beta-lactamase domain-containing protein n=1 Tax=Mycolicibacterium murale TaxID=182220 RepID=A0A7I9WMZ1_9MYCO|nr:hypothetical protein MMUR_28440 [Mycolicibacterium murale]
MHLIIPPIFDAAIMVSDLGAKLVDNPYTGHVEPRSEARRSLSGADIVKISVGPYDNNTYIVRCSESGRSLVIDAANDADVIIESIRRHSADVALIVTTHGHEDHWQALADVSQFTGAPTAAHRCDSAELPVPPDRLV